MHTHYRCTVRDAGISRLRRSAQKQTALRSIKSRRGTKRTSGGESENPLRIPQGYGGGRRSVGPPVRRGRTKPGTELGGGTAERKGQMPCRGFEIFRVEKKNTYSVSKRRSVSCENDSVGFDHFFKESFVHTLYVYQNFLQRKVEINFLQSLCSQRGFARYYLKLELLSTYLGQINVFTVFQLLRILI